jgi:hypothetical protein
MIPLPHVFLEDLAGQAGRHGYSIPPHPLWLTLLGRREAKWAWRAWTLASCGSSADRLIPGARRGDRIVLECGGRGRLKSAIRKVSGLRLELQVAADGDRAEDRELQ